MLGMEDPQAVDCATAVTEAMPLLTRLTQALPSMFAVNAMHIELFSHYGKTKKAHARLDATLTHLEAFERSGATGGGTMMPRLDLARLLLMFGQIALRLAHTKGEDYLLFAPQAKRAVAGALRLGVPESELPFDCRELLLDGSDL